MSCLWSATKPASMAIMSHDMRLPTMLYVRPAKDTRSLIICLFVRFDSFHTSHQSFSYVGVELSTKLGLMCLAQGHNPVTLVNSNLRPFGLESSTLPLSHWAPCSLIRAFKLLVLEYSMTVKLLSEQHLEFLNLKGGCTGSSESHLSKRHIV